MGTELYSSTSLATLGVTKHNVKITNTIGFPLYRHDEVAYRIVGIASFIIPVTIFIENLNVGRSFPGESPRRSMGHDQMDLFRSIEMGIATMGIDGKQCLLRTICEIQSHPIGEWSIFGEMLTVLLTPKKGVTDFLHDYIEAEEIGRSKNQTCEYSYTSCPFSVFNLFKKPPGPIDYSAFESNVIP